MSTKVSSHNFQFLAAYDMQLVRLGALAENYFQEDPNTCVIKLRQFGELLAQQVAARTGVYLSADEPQTEVLRRLRLERIVPREALDLFHQIRMASNRAAYADTGTTRSMVFLSRNA